MRTNGQFRWLWCWLGVLVASCSSGAVTPTPLPTLVLLHVNWLPATATPILKLLRTPTFYAPTKLILTLAPTLPVLPIDPPDCYETPMGTQWCLGLLTNTLNAPIENVKVRVYLLAKDGTALAEGQNSIARNALMPGESSPYGVLFDSMPDGVAGPVAILADLAINKLPQTVSLDISGTKFAQKESLYEISGTLHNNRTTPVSQLSVIVTLFDTQNRVTGFRQYRWAENPTVDSGVSMPFNISVAPQGLGTLRFTVQAEGQPRDR